MSRICKNIEKEKSHISKEKQSLLKQGNAGSVLLEKDRNRTYNADFLSSKVEVKLMFINK